MPIADRYGEFIYHNFKIIYQSFESSMQKLTMGEAEMFFLNIVLYAPKAW